MQKQKSLTSHSW